MAMLLYVVLVYGWSLWLYPLGRDFAYLSQPRPGLPPLVKYVLSWEVTQFGTALYGYHLVNIGLMLACMLLLYRFVNIVLGGPAWFGTLAATLFMSNPAHSEAMLNLCGAVDLIPCCVALLALWAYASASARPGIIRGALAMGAFALAVFSHCQNTGLPVAIVLYEVFIARSRKKAPELLVYLFIGAAALYVHRTQLVNQGFSFERAFVPLYFLFYPIGFLPETLRAFSDPTWGHWITGLAVAATVIILTLICRKARRREIVFGLLAMAAVRLPQSGCPVDPIHLVGGGQLLLANVFFVAGLSSLFYRIMENQNWRATIVSATTLLCIAFFGMEISSIAAWRHAGRLVNEFQRRASELAAAHPGESLGILPDYQYFQGAPILLSESITRDTPFSKAISAKSLLPMYYEKKGRMRFEVQSSDAQGYTVRVRCEHPLDLLPQPTALTHVGATAASENARYEVVALDRDSMTISVKPASHPLPERIIPAGE